MQPQVMLRILGLLVMIFSMTMLPPIVIDVLYGEQMWAPFVYALIILLGLGTLMWYPFRTAREELRTRDGFLVVVLFWLALGLSGAVPLILSSSPHLSLADAVFESMSALTTTGATVITGIDDLPKSILFYRQQLQWLGGMGIIVLAVAILPMLGVGGMQLYRAETPGPVKDSKLTPRITETAKALWYIYLGLTLACMALLWLAGMSWFDAIAHAFSTVAIGGFSTHDASIGYFNSGWIEAIIIVFMFLAGVNFSLHFAFVRQMSDTGTCAVNTMKGRWGKNKVPRSQRSSSCFRRLSLGLKAYGMDAEFRTYFALLFGGCVLVFVWLHVSETFSHAGISLRHAIFQTVSIATTAGFATENFSVWPGFLPVLLIFLSFVGGCAGSTGGGMKVIRFALLLRQGAREIKRLIHPSAEVAVKIGGKSVRERVISAVWGFFALYVALFAVIMLLLMASGLDQVTAFSAVAACLNNLGPGLGDVAAHYGDINDFSKWLLVFAMLAGRLEIFSILVLLSPDFWRR
jgi:trk system potassium uptake protein